MKINKQTADLYRTLNLNNRINMKSKEGLSLDIILWQHKSVLIERIKRVERYVNGQTRPGEKQPRFIQD